MSSLTGRDKLESIKIVEEGRESNSQVLKNIRILAEEKGQLLSS